MKRGIRTWLLSITVIIAALALVFATYAWFTSNRAVSAGTATARTGDETLELQISEKGGSSFQSVETASIQQVNQWDSRQLMPVSTADLQQFVAAPVTASGMASVFQLVENEENYYHGRIYLRAEGSGWSAGSRMNLYLDQSDGLLGQASSGQLLHAARLGLRFDDGTSVIFRLDDSSDPSSQRVYNTVVNGTVLGDNQVLKYQNGNVTPVTDPGIPVSDRTVVFDNNSIQLPAQPLLSMEFGRVYTLDVYFYLEGCDPDCSDAINFDAADLHLAFYGALQEAGQ